MGILGSDGNKIYADTLLNRPAGSDAVSYSHTFFLSEPTNKEMTEAALNLSDPMKTGQNYCPKTVINGTIYFFRGEIAG